MEVVLVASSKLEADARALISSACEDSGVYAEFVSDSDIIAQRESLTPSLLVACLREGQRSVPASVTEISEHVFPGLPVLLLCEDSVDGGWRSVAAGSLTMIGAPWSSKMLGSVIRATISRVPVFSGCQTVLSELGNSSDSLVFREHRGDGFWVGTAHSVAGASDSLRFQLSSDGLTLACCEANEKGLVAGVDFSAAKREWSFAPGGTISDLWLISDQRIPAITDLTRCAPEEDRVGTLAAASGDLLVLFYGADVPACLSPVDGEFSEAVQNGGPCLLDYIASTCERQQLSLGALVVGVL